MGFVKFDYGYNMTVNISVGAVNSVCWLAWSAWHWKSRPYVRKVKEHSKTNPSFFLPLSNRGVFYVFVCGTFF